MTGNEKLKIKDQMQLPLTHIERMDELQVQHGHEERLASIKANAEVEKKKLDLQQQRLNRWKAWDEDLRTMLGIALIVLGVFGLVLGIWWMWANSPAKTPEELKQDRATSCEYSNDDKDVPHYTWWPEEAGGQGICLPQGQKPPSQQAGS